MRARGRARSPCSPGDRREGARAGGSRAYLFPRASPGVRLTAGESYPEVPGCARRRPAQPAAKGLGGQGQAYPAGIPGPRPRCRYLGLPRVGWRCTRVDIKPKDFPSCTQSNVYFLPGDPRHSHYCQWHVNQKKSAECTRSGVRRGLEPSLRVPRPAPPRAGSGDRSGSREAAAGRSRVCRSRVSSGPPGAAVPRPRCALPQSPESRAETRAVSGFVTPAAAAAQAHPGVRRRSPASHFVCLEGLLRSLDFLQQGDLLCTK